MQRAKMLLGNGLLTNEGSSHLRQRRLVQPAFHHEHLASYGRVMTELAARTRDRWSDGQTIDVDREMRQLTLAIVGRTLFGADIETDTPQIGEAMGALLAMMPLLRFPLIEYVQYLPLPVARRFRRANKLLNATISRLIEERRSRKAEMGDLLSMLTKALDTEGDGTGMGDEQIRDEAISLFLAGHETTASALTWTFWLLSRHPEIEAKLHREIDRELSGRLPHFDDLSKLAWTQHVFAESLRLYPPAWALGRMVVQPVEIGQYLLPARSIVLISPYVMHRSSQYWPNADSFEPERWEQVDQARPRFAYFPFGGGSRLCVGERFAWMEGTLLLATIAQRWRFRISPDTDPSDPAPILLRPRGGVQAEIEERR
jgi:cytochrome P450